MQLLVKEGGAAPEVRDRWGNTPLAEAKRANAVQVRTFLEAWLKDPKPTEEQAEEQGE